MYPFFQYNFLGLVQAIAAIAALIAGWLTWKRRHRTSGVLWLTHTLWASSWWAAMGGLELCSTGLGAKVLFSQLSYFGITLAPVAFWRFAHDYAFYGEKPNRALATAVWLWVGLTIALVFTNPLHRLLWPEVRLVESLGLFNAVYERGPWFWLNVLVCYGLALSASIMLLSHAIAAQRATRIQNWILVFSVLCPWLFSLAYILRLPVIGEVDNTPLGFAGAGVLLSWNMLRFGLFDSLPLAGNVLLERMPDPVFVTDEAGRLAHANPAAVSRFGLSLRAETGKPVEETLAGRPLLVKALRQAASEGLVPFSENGAWWELLSSSLHDRRGRERGRLHVLRETTELRRALVLADENARKAERASQAKSLFIAQVSHDLRTPLHAILGMLNVYEASGGGPDAAGGARGRSTELATVREAAQSLLTLVNGLLDVSRIEAGRIDLVSRPFLLSGVLGPVADLLGVIARKKGLELSCTILPAASGGMRGDPERLRQILVNIVGNAVKFTARGRVSLTADAVPGDARFVRITVEDTGPGIPASALPTLFDAFERGDPDIASRHEGSGLGLAISKRLVGAMKGAISVTSEPGSGTRFEIRLPLADPEALAELESRKETETTPGAEATSRRRSAVASEHGQTGGETGCVSGGVPPENAVPVRPARRVLLADDEPLSRRVNEAMLRLCGCEVDVVEDGADALARLEAGRYDAVLLDGMMPGLDGWETCRRVRAMSGGRGASLPVIAISGDLMPEALARWNEAGATLVLPKPLPKRELQRALDTLV